MDRPYATYLLQDPLTKGIRYVGKTRQKLGDRLYRHIRDARESAGGRWSDNTHRANGIRKVLDSGQKPLIVEICRYQTLHEVNAAERLFIYHMRAAGKDLTNITAGGDGGIVSRKPACSDRVVVESYNQGLSSTKIAKRFKTCKKRVLAVLKAAGVSLRPKGCPRRMN